MVEEVIVIIGFKEGLVYLVLVIMNIGDMVLVFNLLYLIYFYGFVIVGVDICYVFMCLEVDFFEELEKVICESWFKFKMLVLNFLGNFIVECVELDFFEKVVVICKEY